MNPKQIGKEKREKIYREIETIVERIACEYDPQKIILFGSCARGYFDRDSDIDLFIIKETDRPRYERAYQVATLLDHRLPVDIVVYTPGEVEERLSYGDFFVKEIMDEGRVLYEREDS